MTDDGIKDLKKQLLKLPRRAVVAFIARCARRVQPLTNDLPRRHRMAVERAIEVAKTFPPAIHYLKQINSIVLNAENTSAYADSIKAYPSAFAARAAAFTANTVREGNHKGTAIKRFVELAVEVIRATNDAAQYAVADTATDELTAAKADTIFGTSLKYDLEHLHQVAPGPPHSLGKPIDPSESGPLGPLWPHGTPDWYEAPSEETSVQQEPSLEPSPERLVLEAYVDEFADTEEVAEALANLGYALNAYHIACGGNGLVIDDWEIRVPVQEPVGVE